METHKGLLAWIGILLLPVVALGTGRILHKTEQATAAPVTQIASIAWPRDTARTPAQRGAAAATGSAAPVESLVEGLVRRLEDEPGDAKGWALLAQSYAFLDEADHAESALAKAVALGSDETDLRRRLEAARSGTSEVPPTVSTAAPAIRGVVTLAGAPPSLPSEARLFVIARAGDGSPMPVAVLAMETSRFPIEFALGDEHSMLPGVGLRQFDELAVSARISRSGEATREPGDIESAVQIVSLADSPVIELLITPQ